ncbi:hypothetical protein AB0756_34470 [Tolypothrix campylonemoides VB511288_2]|uniref:Uncharacterized protein n=2 Tax=Nostocales TaxID=1161 RepID=A0ABW8WXB4_9CYAN|nr:hypothetical protein [Tolypothrix bouteillei]
MREDYRLPKTAQEREALAILIGTDGFLLLDAIYAETSPPLSAKAASSRSFASSLATTISCAEAG